MSKSVDNRRRKFLSDSSKLMAAASLSTVLPAKLHATEWLPGGNQAAEPPESWMKMPSMLAARPAELGAQIFADVPKPVRSSTLQIQSVLGGIKPGCRLSLWVEELQVAMDYLKGLNCGLTIEQVTVSQASYAHASLSRREQLKAKPRIRVYIAKSAADARRLATLEVESDYRGLGLSLGYPGCCVDAAVNHDRAFFDEENQVWRQANLNSIAISVSKAADFRCNQFLVESNLNHAGPLSAIAHYPCRLDCPESIALAQETLATSARLWPIWTVTMCELLRAPIAYWSDESWPPEFWDEYCGLALVEARRISPEEWSSLLPAIALGAEETPAGAFPDSVVSLRIGMNEVSLRGAAGESVNYPIAKIGKPRVIDWRSGTVERVA